MNVAKLFTNNLFVEHLQAAASEIITLPGLIFGREVSDSKSELVKNVENHKKMWVFFKSNLHKNRR